MPPTTRSAIRRTVEAYLDRHRRERDALAGLLANLHGPAGPTSRTRLPGHITCSAVVVDRDCRVLHIRHRATGLLLAPGGGHVESDDRTLLAAALRKVCEEAGIQPGELCLSPQFLGVPIDIDVHDIHADPAKDEPAHQHFEFRFVFYLVSEQSPAIALQGDKDSGVEWRPFYKVSSPRLRAKLLDAGLDGRPEPVNASALIHDGAGRCLLHLRDHRDGIWEPGAFALLGGGREMSDPSLEATLRRELTEEVPGLEPTALMPYALDDAESIDGLSVPIQVYSGRWSGDPDTVDLREGVLLRWFTPDMLDRLRLSPATRDLIPQHAAQHAQASGATGSMPAARNEAPEETELHVIGVHLYLEDDHGRLLLGLRHPDSSYAGNTWHFLAVHSASRLSGAGLSGSVTEIFSRLLSQSVAVGCSVR
ncbi:NUDIX domain-containing protein [Streptomyces sp. NPDC002187]|uniref:NUDIX hydrolase n=1 Tax=Streptomyces sp. NPDC002187 TaxID=3364637 RepID=UPI0036C3FEF9